MPPYWVSAGLMLIVALAALLAGRRRALVRVRVDRGRARFLLVADPSASRVTVDPARGRPADAVTAWPGAGAGDHRLVGLLLAAGGRR